MLMNEIFNSTVPLQWTAAGPERAEASFVVDNKQYRLFIEAQTFQVSGKALNFLNVGFERADDQTGAWTQELMSDTKHVHYVLGAVVNGLAQQIKQYQTDAVVMFIRDNVEQRYRIYEWIARRFQKQFGGLIPNIPIPGGGKAIILIGNKIDVNTTVAFKQYIQGQNK